MHTKKPVKILVVDDTEATRYAISRVLRNEGYEIETAANGKTALEKVKSFQPALVTLDIHLPDISGFDVCRQIKKNHETSHVVVLQISASYVTNKDKIQGLEGGADSYLAHPVDSSVLTATIKSLLRLRSVSAELREREEMLSLAVDSADLGTWDCDPTNGTMYSSDKCKAIYGFSPDTDVSSEMYLDRIFPEDRATMEAEYAEILSGHRHEVANEFRIRLPDGKVRWLASKGTAKFNMEGSARKAEKMLGTVMDITERKQYLEVLSKAKDAAENANRTKTQFIANISHEIRTPLGAILGFADIILENQNLEEDVLNYLGIIKRNAHQLSKLIDEILDMSKIEADKMEIENLEFDLLEVIHDVVSLMQVKAHERSIDLKVTVDGRIPKYFESDPTRIRQILINLIMNALKFTERGSVQVEISAPGGLTLGKPFELQVDVVDSGIGMSEEQSQRLFQPFMQADNSTTRRFGGSGLGLSLSAKLAQMLGGTLELASSVQGKGSRFRLKLHGKNYNGLPNMDSVEANGAAASVQKPWMAPTALKDRRILVVEDAKENQIILEHLLEYSGAVVETANDGYEGINKALSGAYDVVIMDIQMPHLDGYEAVQKLRQKSYQIPVIALTAHALKGEREKCIGAGFSDYLTKPIDRRALIEKLKLHLH